MRYIIGVLIPILLRSFVVFIVIAMNTGNGSWAGLAAFLLGMFAIPATGIANFFYIRARKDRQTFSVMWPCFLMALIMPIIVLLLVIIG